MVSKYTVDYHPSRSQLISTIRFHISMDSWGAYLSKIFLKFFFKPVYSIMVAETFQMYSVKIIANTFLSQKIESVHFYSCFQTKLSPKFLSLSFRQTRIAHFSQTNFFEDIFSWGERGGEVDGIEKITKINKIKVSLTSFDKLHHLFNLYIFGLCFVVQNLASSMLKCEGSLTSLIKFSLKDMMRRNIYMEYTTLPYPIF